MSSDEKHLSRLEAWALLAVSALLMAWYAYPQALFAMYAPYEVLRLLFPGLPDLAAAGGLFPGLPGPVR